MCDVGVVLEVDLAGVDGVVSDNPHDIEGLLDLLRQAFLNQICDVCIKIFSLFAEVFTKLLDGESEKGSCSSGRGGNDGAGFFVVGVNMVREVEIWERCR